MAQTIEPNCTCTYWYEQTAHLGADLLCGEPEPDCPIHGHWLTHSEQSKATHARPGLTTHHSTERNVIGERKLP